MMRHAILAELMMYRTVKNCAPYFSAMFVSGNK